MRRLLLLLLSLMPVLVSASGTVTFETFALPTADTYYVNYTAPGTDVGLNASALHFPCVYDTGFGAKFWSSGFVLSNKHDSVNAGFTNQYSAKPGHGNNNSQKYLMVYGAHNAVSSSVSTTINPTSFYITNSTYAYYSMLNGDAFAKKFGGVSGNDPDWFKLTIHGYRNGVKINDSVEFYLADFRFANSAQDYILKDWRKVDIGQGFLGIDSLTLDLSSSDTGSFGMNTPAYFATDDWFLYAEGVEGVSFNDFATLSPNPAANFVRVDLKDMSVKTISIMDMAGRAIATLPVASQRTELNTSTLPAGQYLLRLEGVKGTSTTRFIKQ